ncbi:MAG: leucine-rich repeat domain-containing protein [Clostridia bacterium]|nr:leucine-rich repeat domain-containing protein [Clostridia bacterium]
MSDLGTSDVTIGSDETDDSALFLNEKEKNFIHHVLKLIELGDFEEADKSIRNLESDEMKKNGEASAAVYYCKLLIENRVSSEELLFKKFSHEKRTLKNEKNYVFAVSSKDDSSFKDRLENIETRLENLLKGEAETKQEKDKALFERRIAYFRKAMATIFVCLIAALVVGIFLGTTVHNVSGGVITVSVAFVSLVMLIALGGMSASKKKDAEYSVSGANFVRKTSAKDKKIAISILLAVIALSVIGFCFFLPIRTASDADGFTYSVASSYCFVTGYEGDTDTVEIPSEYKNRPVVQIGRKVFMDNTEITAVSIPESATKISVSAFEGCSSLESVEMSGGVKVICEDAFLRCVNLTAIDLTGVRKIGVDAFGGCSGLTGVKLSEGLRIICKHAFMGCNHVEEITIPSSVRTIKSQAFYNTTRLKYIHFADTDGWKRKGVGSVDSDVLSNPENAAALLVDDNKTWKHR